MPRSRSRLKKDILTHMVTETKAQQFFVGFTLDEIAVALGENVPEVKSALREMITEGHVSQEGSTYTTGPVTRYEVSREIQNAEERRLLELDLESLASDSPDYLKKALAEAATQVKVTKPAIVSVTPQIVDQSRLKLAIINRDGKLYTTEIDLSEQLEQLDYYELVKYLEWVFSQAG